MIPLPRPPSPPPVDLSQVVMRDGPPTRGELAKFYPARYTWRQLKDFIKSGDLGLLKRDPVLQKRYNAWATEARKEHGSITNYLVNVRLGWGVRSEPNTPPTSATSPWSSESSLELRHDELGPSVPPPEVSKLMYFTSDSSPENVKILFNDWPYSIPPEISHYVVWSRLPVVHPALVHPSVAALVDRDGLWGFTGVDPPEGEGMIQYHVAPGTSPADRDHILAAGAHVQQFISRHWPEDLWEVAWFVNPPRIQSVKDLSHIHVFARKKVL